MSDPDPKPRKSPPLWISLLPLLLIFVLLVVGYGMYRIKPQVILVAAAFLTGCLALTQGVTWDEMQKGITESIHKAMPAILIMLCVGILVGSWMASGTIPMIVSYGLRMVSPQYFLLTACLVCSIVSLATGTSWGTVATLGVAFLGIAGGLGVPLAPAAGAIVAGSYFGDKMSPFSDVANLAPVAAGSNLFDHLKHMMWSAIPAWLCGLGFYLVYGLRYGSVEVRAEGVDTIIRALDGHFRFSVLLLLPVVVVFYFACAKRPVIPGMLISSLLACLLAVIYQRAAVTDLAAALNSGYVAKTGLEGIDRLLSRGGLMSMMETQLVAFAAFSFGGIMRSAGFLDVIIHRVLKWARTVFTITVVTVASSVLTALVTGSSYLSMLIPGELLSPVYREKGLAAKNLSRIIEECGAIIVPLVPWSMAGVFITGTLGVSPADYAPWAVMNYAAVVVLLLFGLTGFTMARRSREDETQPGS